MSISISKHKIIHSCGHESTHAIIGQKEDSDKISISKNFIDKKNKKCSECYLKDKHVFNFSDDSGFKKEYVFFGEKEAQESKANQFFLHELELHKNNLREIERIKKESEKSKKENTK